VIVDLTLVARGRPPASPGVFIDSEENYVLRAWSEFNGFAS